MNELYEALENCLQAVEQGADIESAVARYPDLAAELRPILGASVAAQSISVPEPSSEVARRGRARLLQRAAELREAKRPARPRVIPAFQRLAIALTLAAIFLTSGTGLVRASASALPGESLYPVKRTWEGLRLIFVFDAKLREVLRSEYEIERLHEVTELLAEGRHETIQFAGVLTEVNGVRYVSGIHLVILDSTRVTGGTIYDGAAVIVMGHTNAQGFVEADSIQLLPPGSLVPVGNPIEVETEEAGESSSGNGAGLGSRPDAGTPGKESDSHGQSLHMEGTVDEITNNTLIVNGQTFYLDNAEIRGVLRVGAEVKLEGYFAPDGRFIVTKVEVEEEDSELEDDNENSNSNENESGDESDDNSNDEGDDGSGEDDNSGHGGGDDDD